jgi:AmmeMemoRadiSam system protein A
MKDFAQHLSASAPESLVLISPHSPRRPNEYGIWRTRRLRGSFSHLSDPQDHIDLPLDHAMADAIETAAHEEGLRTWSIQGEALDHGATVPLWFLVRAGWEGPTVVLGLTDDDGSGLARLGVAIRNASARLERRTAIIASGDMSHCLTASAPCGYEPRGRVFDETFVGLLRQGSYGAITDIDSHLQSSAAEDVVDSTLVATAASGGSSEGHQVLSYEGPFGVGYCVAILHESPRPPAEEILGRLEQLPLIARRSITEGLSGGRGDPGLHVTGDLLQPGCVFVTLHGKDGELRGCMGTLRPCEDNIALETWMNARSAAFNDHRFRALDADSLDRCDISVTVLGRMEPVENVSQLDPAIYGVTVRSADGRRGVLLPAIPGVDTPEQQLSIARHKAGIGPEEETAIKRFRVLCIHEAQARA